MSKSAAIKIAEHFGADVATVRELAYQPGRFTRAVYAIGEAYWCAGDRPAQSTRGAEPLEWQRVESSYDGSTLWRATA